MYFLHSEKLPQVSVIVKEGNVNNVPCKRWVVCQRENSRQALFKYRLLDIASIIDLFGTEREQQAVTVQISIDSPPGVDIAST